MTLRTSAPGTARALLGALALFASGCVETDYLLQAAEGQLDLACRARSIESAIEDENLDPHTRALLADVPNIKSFAKKRGLVPTSSYEDFVALDRGSVVYVVNAAPELSLEPRRWTFPIVGSVPYLGWFDKELAQTQARQLAEQGWDVDVRGASAYSTLGWFNDPVLSSMIPDEPDALAELANTILHESLHATVYVPGQSTFNEGLATFVGDSLTAEYFTLRDGPGSLQLAEWREGEAHGKEVQQQLHAAYVELDTLYRSKLSRTQKLEKKAEILARVRRDTGFRRPISNATLTGFATYHSDEAGFERLYAACHNDLSELIGVVKTVKDDDFPERNAKELSGVLKKLTARCPTAR